jgi:hypothetical protein
VKIGVTYVCRFYRTTQQTHGNYKKGPINAVFMEKIALNFTENVNVFLNVIYVGEVTFSVVWVV